MWYLLVAAGAGYLAQRWQNTHKSQPLFPGKYQSQRPSSPSSTPATPKGSSFSVLGMDDPEAGHNGNTSSNSSFDKEGISGDCKAPLPCFGSGNVEDNIPYAQVGKVITDSPQGNSLCPQVLKSKNKRSACEAFLVPVPDAFKPIEGNKKDQIVTNPRSNSFITIEEITQDQFVASLSRGSEVADVQQITKSQSVSTSKPSLGSTNIKWNAKDQVAKPNLDFIDTDNKEQLQGDSTSPSSCCSSSSTVINSPIGRKHILHKLEPFRFQGKEQRCETNACGPLGTLQNHVARTSSQSFLEKSTLKGGGQGVLFRVSKYDCPQETYPEALQNKSPRDSEECLSNQLVVAQRSNINAVTSFNAPVFTDDNEMVASSTDGPYVFTGENQKDRTITEHFRNEFMENDKVKLTMKQGTFSVAGDMNFPREETSLLSPRHNAATESAYEAESESLVSFGLAMAVFFMVSSSKKEMDKMGKVLKETEDLVSDMRKELDERRAQSCLTSLTLSDNECNEKLPTMKSKDAVAQVGIADSHVDSCCQVGLSDDESIRSAITEEHTQYGWHSFDPEPRCEVKLQFVETNVDKYFDSGKHNEENESEDEKDLSTLEETGEDACVLSMLELERKLWKVFQDRQEEKILELEAALEVALSKLHEKEEELQWWKNRAAWLMEHRAGITSGAMSGKRRVERVEEGFNDTDKLSFLIKDCDPGEKITHKFSACDRNGREFSAGETSFLALEEECIEIVGNVDGTQSRAGYPNEMERIDSSSEESDLSFDVRTFTYPECMGSIQLARTLAL